MKRQNASEDATATLTLRVTPRIKAEVESRAECAEVTMSRWVVEAIEERIELDDTCPPRK
jgi:predicted HicB family RNase H-like nuclease